MATPGASAGVQDWLGGAEGSRRSCSATAAVHPPVPCTMWAPGGLISLSAVVNHGGAFLRFLALVLGLKLSFQDNLVSWKQVPVMAFLTSG